MSLKGFALCHCALCGKKQAVLNFVPFVGSGADSDWTSIISPVLSAAAAIPVSTADSGHYCCFFATVSGDYEPLSRRVAFSAKRFFFCHQRDQSLQQQTPLCQNPSIPTDTPASIAMNVVNTIRHRLAFGLVRKVMGINRAGFPLGFVRSARILLVSQDFLLFRVHRNGRFTTPGFWASTRALIC